MVGASWEGYVIENLLSIVPTQTEAGFYRTAAGAEIDLVLALPGQPGPWAIEIKRSLSPKPSKGFWHGCEDIEPSARFIVYPGTERFPIGPDTDVICLEDLMQLIVETSRGAGT